MQTLAQLDLELRRARDERIGDPGPEAYWPVAYRSVLREVVLPLRRARSSAKRHSLTLRLGRLAGTRLFAEWLAGGSALAATERARLARALFAIAKGT